MDYLARAKSDLAEKRAQAADLNKEIEELQAVVKRLERYSLEATSPGMALLAEAAGRITRFSEESKKARILAATLDILSTGSACQTRALIAALKGRGVEVGGADEVAMLSSYLSREKDKFEFVRPDGWKLKKQSPTDALTSIGLN